MSETASEAMASAEAGGTSQTAAALERAELSIRELLEAGVHFGHQARRWNPRMKRYLFGERNGIHIVDLDQTLPLFEEALEFLREVTASGGRVLFVGTKRQAQAPLMLEAQRAGQFYVNNRWLGGMLTNFKTVKKSIDHFKSLLEILADEQRMAEYTKKQLSEIQRTVDKYRKSVDGIREMTRLPDAIFVIDVECEAIAVSEARRLAIPIVAVVDSNCSPEGIDYVIPGNDDSLRAIQLYASRVADACLEGAAIHQERLREQQIEQERARAEEKTSKPGGRVVVEIQHTGGRTASASFGGRRDELEDETPPVAAPVAPADGAESA